MPQATPSHKAGFKHTSDSARTGAFSLPPLALISILFTAVFLMHVAVLRLPYFWDEAGHYVPAARDLLLTGDPIPRDTISNAHPPLVMGWLALWWKLSGFTPAVTRTAMLLVSAFGLAGIFRLASRVARTEVAIAATMLTALYPVWFAQSSLAQLDVAAAAFTIWGLESYIGGRRWPAVAWFAVAGIAKETAIITPVVLSLWEVVGAQCDSGAQLRNGRPFSARLAHASQLLLACIPLALWFAFHYSRTGYLFGNPEFFRYNVAATASPLRIVLAVAERLWHAFGYMNLFALTGAAALAMFAPPLPGREHDRISIPYQLVFAVVLLVYVVMLGVLGGAVLARYMLPVIPLVIIVAVSTIRRRVSWWKWLVGLSCVAFVAALVVNPPYRSAPEDNLNYTDFVRLHRSAAQFIAREYPHSRVLTSWPASDELTKPYLGYVKQPVSVVRIDNFTVEQITLAAQAREQYDLAFLFSTKLEPRHPLLDNWPWWQRIHERFFDYHRDLPPEVASSMLGGRIVFQDRSNGQWVAVAEFPRNFNAQRDRDATDLALRAR